MAFNNSKVETVSSQKHLGLIPDERLNFNQYLENEINKCYKIIGFLNILSKKLPLDALLEIYKSFVRSHLDYNETVYDKPNNESFTNVLERVQYESYLTITGAIQSTFHKRLNKELSLKSLSDKRCARELTFFYKIVEWNSPQYLSDYLERNHDSVYNNRSASQITLNTFKTRTEKLKNYFFPFYISEWN